MRTTATITVIMPVYNYASYLPRALAAIREQSRAPDEILLLDDGSTDDTWSIMEAFAAEGPSVRLLRHEKNQGVPVSFNRLLRECRCDFFYSVSSDDFMEHTAIERIMDAAERYPEVGIVFAPYHIVSPAGDILETARPLHGLAPGYHDPESYYAVLKQEGSSFSLSGSTAYRRDALLELNGWPHCLTYYMDTFVIRAIGLKYGAYYLEDALNHCTAHDDSYSARATRDPWVMLEMAANAYHLMHSEPFVECFPAGHADEWYDDYVDYICGKYEDSITHSYQNTHQLVARVYRHAGKRGACSHRLGIALRSGLQALERSAGRQLIRKASRTMAKEIQETGTSANVMSSGPERSAE